MRPLSCSEVKKAFYHYKPKYEASQLFRSKKKHFIITSQNMRPLSCSEVKKKHFIITSQNMMPLSCSGVKKAFHHYKPKYEASQLFRSKKSILSLQAKI